MKLSNNSIFDNSITAGCDEAGRGCLAGPVFAAAVILPADFSNKLLNDSKKVNKKNRYLLRTEIEEQSLSWAVAYINPSEIDEINILNASIKAMHSALDNLKQEPEAILVDGNKFKPWRNKKYSCIKGGDAKFASIAAASILAKTYRDDFMIKIHKTEPHYNWYKNKGYPTKEHRKAIETRGASIHHRRTFKLTDSQIRIEF